MKKPCCQDPANLERQATDKPDLTVDVCRVCGARHFRLHVEPGVIGVKGTTLGAE